MTRLLMILLLAFSGVGRAEVTAAWKVAIGQFVPDHQNNAQVRKVEKPPGESAFFQRNDELWDVLKVLNWNLQNLAEGAVQGGDSEADPADAEWEGEWLVWNARSGMLVARGSWIDVLRVEKVLGLAELPIVFRTKVELMKGQGESSEPFQLDLVCQRNEPAELEVEGFKLAVEMIPLNFGNRIDTPVRVSWPAGTKDSRWQIHTALTFADGVRYRLGRQGEGDQAWEVFATVTGELTDGTPRSEARWVEKAGKEEAWPRFGKHQPIKRLKLAPERRLGIYPVDEDILSGYLDQTILPAPSDVEAPLEISKWVQGPLVDVRDFLMNQGVKARTGGAFAGYDPLSHRIFFIADPTNQDLADFVLSDWKGDGIEPPLWIESNPESGGWGLACRTGETAAVSRTGGEGKDLLFEAVLTSAGGRGDASAFDFGYEIELVSGSKPVGRLKSATHLEMAVPQQLGSFTSTGEGERKVVVTLSRMTE